MMLVFILAAAFSVPSFAQQSFPAQRNNAAGNTPKTAQQAQADKLAKERQDAQMKAWADRKKAEKEREEQLKNAKRVNVAPSSSATTPGKAVQAGTPLSAREMQQQQVMEQQRQALQAQTEKQKADKERAKNTKETRDGVSKIDSGQNKNRTNPAVDQNRNMKQLLWGD